MPTIVCWPHTNSPKLFSMRCSLLLMLSLAVLGRSATIASMLAQSTALTNLQTTVAITKLAEPSYPPLGLQARIQGEVQIAVGVRRDGTLESASITSGHPVLGRAALESAQKSEYECRSCTEAVTPYSLVYTFRFEDRTHGQSRPLSVTQVGNHITVIDEPPTITATNADPPSTFRKRSPKCLYLWNCGRR
jgi:TonB family protein